MKWQKIKAWLEYRLWLLTFLLMIPFLMVIGAVVIIPRFFRYVEDTVAKRPIRTYKF